MDSSFGFQLDPRVQGGDVLEFEESDEENDPNVINTQNNNCRSRKGRGRPRLPKSSARQTGDENDYFPSRFKRKRQDDSDDGFKYLVPIEKVCRIICCSDQCLAGLNNFLVIKRARTLFTEMSMQQQSQWILEYLSGHSAPSKDGEDIRYIVGTSDVCMDAWRIVHGIDESRLYRHLRKFKDGVVAGLPADYSRQGYRSGATQRTIAWLRLFAQIHGDKMPDKEDKINLPSCLSRRDVYQMCNAQLEADGEKACSESHFYKLWSTHCKDIAIPKVNRFALCTKCSDISARLQSYRSPAIREELKKKRKKHLEFQQAEREKYYKHAAKARNDPNKYLCIIADGMDQSKTFLPHFVDLNKAISAAWKLKIHLTGVKVHGIGLYVFLDHGEFPHSSNLLINILVRVLEIRKDSIPEVLYLQLDNCYRDNKNRFLFAFLSYLVEVGVFRKAKINFLMVGHTHEDIDQFFSKISAWLMRNSAGTVEELLAGVRKSTTPTPETYIIDTLYDVKEWIQPHLQQMTNHSGPHQFRIKKDKETGKAIMVFKNWSTSSSYQQCDGGADGALLKDKPRGQPKPISPNYEKIDLPRLKVDVMSLVKFMSSHERQTTYKDAWTTWFEEASSQNDGNYQPRGNWTLQRTVDHILKKRESERMNRTLQEFPGETLSDLSDEEDPIPVVRIGNKKRSDNANWKEEMARRILQIGDLCILDMAKWAAYAGHQIGKVLEIHEDNRVIIEWMHAPIGKKITPWPEPWTEVVNRSTIYYYGFTLTQRGYLPQYVRDIIDEYEDDF